MVRTPYCNQSGIRKGTWTPEEDMKLVAYVTRYGCWNWRQLPKFAGLARCGKSCRLRWLNYLRPDIKRGNYTPQEDDTIITLHHKLGNRWSKIAACLPGRTDNEIKNHWHTNLRKRVQDNSSVAHKKDKSFFNSSKDQTETPFESMQEMINSPVTISTTTDPSSQCETQISSTLQMPSTDNGAFSSYELISPDALIETMSDNFWAEPYNMVDVSNVLSEEALLPLSPEYEFEVHLWSYNGFYDEYIGSSF